MTDDVAARLWSCSKMARPVYFWDKCSNGLISIIHHPSSFIHSIIRLSKSGIYGKIKTM